MRREDRQEASDQVVSSVVDKVAGDFPWASGQAVESHVTFLRANAVYSATLATLYSDLGLSLPRFNLLWLLYRSDDQRLTISGLADHIGITSPSVMRMVQSLEAEGWVRSVKGTADRRVTFVELSEDGGVRLAGLLEEAIRLWQDIWSDLSPGEMDTLVAILTKLRSSLLRRYLGEAGLAAFRARHHDAAQPSP